jgi:8-oxo-dGTP diphosphatase
LKAPADPVHVAVGVIVDARRRILLSRRAEDAHQGGLWEFPGGKVEPGESLQDALGRELREELAIEPVHTAPLLEVAHDYGDKRVLLDVHLVWEYSGSATGLEGQPLAWVEAAALGDYAFPAANLPIVKAIQAALLD